MVGVLANLDLTTRLKLGSDIATFAMLALSSDRANLGTKVGCLVAGMTSCNEVVRMMLSKENTVILTEQPEMLSVILHDMVKYYGTNKDFDFIAPAVVHLV